MYMTKTSDEKFALYFIISNYERMKEINKIKKIIILVLSLNKYNFYLEERKKKIRKLKKQNSIG